MTENDKSLKKEMHKLATYANQLQNQCYQVVKALNARCEHERVSTGMHHFGDMEKSYNLCNDCDKEWEITRYK